MAKVKNEVGNIYGRLTVICRASNKGGRVAWRCECTCGNQHVVTGGDLRSKRTNSCGCLRREATSERYSSHGLTGHTLYRVWANMKNRTLNPRTEDYHHYGGRGIEVCNEWLRFEPFYAWARGKWRPDLEIDRKDNNGNYEPNNCRFVTRSLNVVNRRKLKMNTSGYTGVSYNISKEMYQSYLSYKALGGQICLGTFSTPEAAVEARNKFIIDNNLPHKIQEV